VDTVAEVLVHVPPVIPSDTIATLLKAHISLTPLMAGTATTVTNRVAAQPVVALV
jgi:hypothetical protein